MRSALNVAHVQSLVALEEKEALIGSFQGVDSAFFIAMDKEMALTGAAITL